MTGFDQIVEIAKQQKGYVATFQLPEISPQLFAHHVSSGNLERVARGIYRITAFPNFDDEEFVVAYLWSKERGVLSHETALSVYQLSDVLPNQVHITLPRDEAPIRREMPEWITVHFGDITQEEQQWYDAVPVTTPARTLIDIAADSIDPDVFYDALDQARARDLVEDNFERSLIRELILRRR